MKTKLFSDTIGQNISSSPIKIDLFQLNKKENVRKSSLSKSKNEITKLLNSVYNIKEIPKDQLNRLRELNGHLKDY